MARLQLPPHAAVQAWRAGRSSASDGEVAGDARDRRIRRPRAVDSRSGLSLAWRTTWPPRGRPAVPRHGGVGARPAARLPAGRAADHRIAGADELSAAGRRRRASSRRSEAAGRQGTSGRGHRPDSRRCAPRRARTGPTAGRATAAPSSTATASSIWRKCDASAEPRRRSCGTEGLPGRRCARLQPRLHAEHRGHFMQQCMLDSTIEPALGEDSRLRQHGAAHRPANTRPRVLHARQAGAPAFFYEYSPLHPLPVRRRDDRGRRGVRPGPERPHLRLGGLHPRARWRAAALALRPASCCRWAAACPGRRGVR